jgi:hypothetical protein
MVREDTAGRAPISNKIGQMPPFLAAPRRNLLSLGFRCPFPRFAVSAAVAQGERTSPKSQNSPSKRLKFL